LRFLPFFEQFRQAGFGLIALVLLMASAAIAIRRNGAAAAAWVERRTAHFAHGLGHSVANRIRAFGEGLNTIHDAASFLQLVGVSVLMWFSIAVAYREIAHAYPEPLAHLTVSHVLLIMGFSMVGSMVQLPAVGGGSQLATISALVSVFDVPNEMAVSCGILLWLVTFMAVIPSGLAIAHREHVSLRQLSKETEVEKSQQETQAAQP
jgi:hypothetical protein